jgi:hypothetical protein
MDFLRLFNHGSLYLLPDDTRVRALLYNMEGLLLEWIFEDLSGVRTIGVLPNGDVVAYTPSGHDQYGVLYQTRLTDMSIDDVRPA